MKAVLELEGLLDDADVMIELGEEADDEESLAEAEGSLDAVRERCDSLEIRRLLGDEGDKASAVLEINSGAGGTDASDWAGMLKRMYLRWSEEHGFKTRLVDEQAHDEAGIKSCTIEIEGEYAYGYL